MNRDVSFAFVLQGWLPNEGSGLFPVSVTHVLPELSFRANVQKVANVWAKVSSVAL